MTQSGLDQIVPDPRLGHACEAIFADATLRDAIREVAFEEQGTFKPGDGRAIAIEALSYFDPDAAFLAAKAALRSRLDGSRERYPYIMVELDSSLAAVELLEHAKTESVTSVIWAIGRALSRSDVKDRLLRYLQSPTSLDRLVACRIASRLEPA